MKKTLTLTELSEYLGIPRRSLYRMIERGIFNVEPIPHIRPRRWNVEQVDAWRLGR
jgi:excisionase family DNA binding protein